MMMLIKAHDYTSIHNETARKMKMKPSLFGDFCTAIYPGVVETEEDKLDF